jgi:hypothetical protein
LQVVVVVVVEAALQLLKLEVVLVEELVAVHVLLIQAALVEL